MSSVSPIFQKKAQVFDFLRKLVFFVRRYLRLAGLTLLIHK